MAVRSDWTLAEVNALFELPFMDLLFTAQQVHRRFQAPNTVQISTLRSIKTGACPEDCAYCPQSLRFDTGLETQELLELEDVAARARAARAAGATRFCMGAAYRSPKAKDLRKVLAMIREVKGLGMETCATLGMLTPEQAQDRVVLLHMLATLPTHPQSVPVNQLVRVAGTPLAAAAPLDPFDFVRTIAVARILMPQSHVRLSAGRGEMSDELQALCFLAGANSIFYGDKLLTTGNPDTEHDQSLFRRLKIVPERAAAAADATIASSAGSPSAQGAALM